MRLERGELAAARRNLLLELFAFAQRGASALVVFEKLRSRLDRIEAALKRRLEPRKHVAHAAAELLERALDAVDALLELGELPRLPRKLLEPFEQCRGLVGRRLRTEPERRDGFLPSSLPAQKLRASFRRALALGRAASASFGELAFLAPDVAPRGAFFLHQAARFARKQRRVQQLTRERVPLLLALGRQRTLA